MRVFPGLFTRVGSVIYQSMFVALPNWVSEFFKGVGTAIVSRFSLLGRVSLGGQGLYSLFFNTVPEASGLKGPPKCDLEKKKSEEVSKKEGLALVPVDANSMSALLDKIEGKLLPGPDYLEDLMVDVRELNAKGCKEKDEGVPKIIRVPGDGNCLFYSVSFGCALTDRVADDPFNLRLMAVLWLEERKEGKAAVPLMSALCSYQESQFAEIGRRRQCSEFAIQEGMIVKERHEQQIQELNKQYEEVDALDNQGYLQLAKQDRFYGGEAEIYALSELLNIGIEVHTYNGDQKISSVCYNEQASTRISLMYNSQISHYDLLIK